MENSKGTGISKYERYFFSKCYSIPFYYRIIDSYYENVFYHPSTTILSSYIFPSYASMYMSLLVHPNIISPKISSLALEGASRTGKIGIVLYRFNYFADPYSLTQFLIDLYSLKIYNQVLRLSKNL